MPCSVYFKAFVPMDQCTALKALGMISNNTLLS